jgi:hypothetical protein
MLPKILNGLLVLLLVLNQFKVYQSATTTDNTCTIPSGFQNSNFQLKTDLDINVNYESNYLIKSIVTTSLSECLVACNLECSCYIVGYDGTTCLLCNQDVLYYLSLKSAVNKKVYVK